MTDKYRDYFQRSEHNRKVYLKRKASGKIRAYSQKVKAEILTHYGNGRLACIMCGFSDIRALSLDHIDGTGWSARRSGHALYHQLRKAGYPEGYQTLCMNCQFIKRQENNEHRLA